MNKVILCGRLTKDPDVRYGANGTCVARYTLAIDRPKREGQDNGADFPAIVALGKTGEFAEKYLRKGMKIIVEGRLQTGSYEKEDGSKVYFTEVLVMSHEFCEKRDGGDRDARDNASMTGSDGFMSIPDGIEEELPFM